eukprot:TRINITY_DN4950_c0_g1_i1.p4 TRINITY_DN4950_c0_g1~~TRINITY_DN4950_c0_g1_i1.p4  ORF type:complete len:118 (-),score=26.02 TRINITY_DN4950_c0_g1_i1:289-642(-)
MVCSFILICFQFMLFFWLFCFFFFFKDTATTEIYTLHIVGSVRCVQETGTWVMKIAFGTMVESQKCKLLNLRLMIQRGSNTILKQGTYNNKRTMNAIQALQIQLILLQENSFSLTIK